MAGKQYQTHTVLGKIAFYVAPIVCGGSVFGIFCNLLLNALSKNCNSLDEGERAGCFALDVFLVSSDC